MYNRVILSYPDVFKLSFVLKQKNYRLVSKKNSSCIASKRKIRKLISWEISKSNAKMCPFAGFDNTCDLSAVLGILERASVFHTRVHTYAKDVRSKMRNEWGHCNFDHWTDVEFQNSFQLMETMVRSLGLPKPDEDKELDKLRDWETKG